MGIFAKIDRLRTFQAELPDLLPLLEAEAESRDEQIEETTEEIQKGIARAEEILQAARSQLAGAEAALAAEEERVRIHNANLREDQQPIEVNPMYERACRRARSVCEKAERQLSNMEDTRDGFIRKVSSYRDDQNSALMEWKKLYEKSSAYMEAYTDMLYRAKLLIYSDQNTNSSSYKDFRSSETDLLLDGRPELRGTNRARLLQGIMDVDLLKIANELYRPGASQGDGGTATALILEVESGDPKHLTKARQRLSELHKLGTMRTADGKIKINGNDRDILDALSNDLEAAIRKAESAGK